MSATKKREDHKYKCLDCENMIHEVEIFCKDCYQKRKKQNENLFSLRGVRYGRVGHQKGELW